MCFTRNYGKWNDKGAVKGSKMNEMDVYKW